MGGQGRKQGWEKEDEKQPKEKLCLKDTVKPNSLYSNKIFAF